MGVYINGPTEKRGKGRSYFDVTICGHGGLIAKLSDRQKGETYEII